MEGSAEGGLRFGSVARKRSAAENTSGHSDPPALGPVLCPGHTGAPLAFVPWLFPLFRSYHTFAFLEDELYFLTVGNEKCNAGTPVALLAGHGG